MAIYRGPGGAGDATGDATNASALALAAKNEAEASAAAASASAAAALAASEASINLTESLQVDVTTLAEGSSATASYDSGSTTITFGIPTGDTGATGAPGDTGPGVPTGGSTGQYLKKDSSTDFDTSWADVDALPSQTGNSGKYLTTDGTDPSWATLDTDANSTTKGLYEMSATISANYSITSGNNAMSAGPITVADGVTVTVPSGSVWTIV